MYAGVVFSALSVIILLSLFNPGLVFEASDVEGGSQAPESDVQSENPNENQMLPDREMLLEPEPLVNQELAPPIIDVGSSFQLGQIIRLSDSEYPAKPAIAVSGNDVARALDRIGSVKQIVK